MYSMYQKRLEIYEEGLKENLLSFPSRKKAKMLALNKYFEINFQIMVRKRGFICFQHFKSEEMTSKDPRHNTFMGLDWQGKEKYPGTTRHLSSASALLGLKEGPVITQTALYNSCSFEKPREHALRAQMLSILKRRRQPVSVCCG